MDDIQRLARAAQDHGLRIAVAESLTSGLLAAEVGKREHAGTWFAGGVVAYLMEIKDTVLGVTRPSIRVPRSAPNSSRPGFGG